MKKLGHFWLFMVLALLLALPGIVERLVLERSRRGALIVADTSRNYQLSDWSDTAHLMSRMTLAGVNIFMTGEYTGAEILEGALRGVTLPEDFLRPEELVGENWTALATDGAYVDAIAQFLSLRFPGTLKAQVGGKRVFYLPIPRRQALKAGLLPDFGVLEVLKAGNLPYIYRPMPYGYGDAQTLLAGVDWVMKTYPGMKALAPGGDVVAAYPDSASIGAFVKEKGLLMVMPEFSTQVGASAGWHSSWPNVTSMHAVTDDEVITRKINRSTMLRRLERAAFERNVALLVLRPDALRGDNERLATFEGEVAALKTALESHGIRPRLVGSWPSRSFMGALTSSLALGLLAATLLWQVAGRFGLNVKAILVLPLAVVWALAAWKIGPVARLTGGLTTGLLATEAALYTMSAYRAPLRGLILGLVMVFMGGLTLVAFYSTPLAMARLQPFSGVKLTLLLPLVLVFLHDLTGGEHPEKLGHILGRSSQWMELVVIGGLLLAGLVMVVRSDNTSFVPGFERLMRDGLEKLLVARPRTKELWIGYPALVLWFVCRRKNLIPAYREALRLAGTLAFASAVNTFCHFHTPLYLSLLRTFHGWWMGLLVGLVVTVVVMALRKRLLRQS